MPATVVLKTSNPGADRFSQEFSDTKSLQYGAQWVTLTQLDGTVIRFATNQVIAITFKQDKEDLTWEDQVAKAHENMNNPQTNAHNVYEVDLNEFQLLGHHNGTPVFTKKSS